MAREFGGDEAKRRRHFAAVLHATARKRDLGQVLIETCCAAVGIDRDQTQAESYHALDILGREGGRDLRDLLEVPGVRTQFEAWGFPVSDVEEEDTSGEEDAEEETAAAGRGGGGGDVNPAPIAAAALARRTARGTRSRSRMSIEARG